MSFTNYIRADAADPRNIITTICALPETFGGMLTCVVNNGGIQNTLRNFMMLQILATKDPKLAAEIVIHLWFSARLPPKVVALIKEVVLPTMERMLLDWPAGSTSPLEARSYDDEGPLDTCTLTMSFTRTQLISMLQIFRASYDPSVTLAQRSSVFSSALTKDPRDLEYAMQRPEWRTSTEKYRKTGVLAPLRADLGAFTAANP